MNTEILSALFENGAYTLVVQKNGVTVHKDFGRGVGPALIAMLEPTFSVA